MTITCIIIDDEPLAIQIIEGHIAQIPDLECIASFQNPVEAMGLLKTQKVDLLFSDIEMPLVNGIEFVKSLQNPPKVIFTTAFRNYAIESYDLDVVDYLLKPIPFARFFKAVNRYRTQMELVVPPAVVLEKSIVNDHIYVNANKKFIKILFSEILYIESIKDYVRIHTSSERIVTKDTLRNFEVKLPSNFLRVHRSYLVNRAKITAFTAVDIELGTIEIPIGTSYKDAVMNRLKK
jgi:DNA-binding LytR/AlgR family response regulator